MLPRVENTPRSPQTHEPRYLAVGSEDGIGTESSRVRDLISRDLISLAWLDPIWFPLCAGTRLISSEFRGAVRRGVRSAVAVRSPVCIVRYFSQRYIWCLFTARLLLVDTVEPLLARFVAERMVGSILDDFS